MRVLLTTFGSRGDVQPLLAAAIELRKSGADARVCAPADDEFVKAFAAAGVPLFPAFTQIRDWITDNETLWNHDIHVRNEIFGKSFNALRDSVSLPRIDNVRDYCHANPVLLAADPVLAPWCPTVMTDVVQTGAWMLADDRALPPDLVAFLDTGEPPVYVGLGSLPAPKDFARTAIDAVRAHGQRILLSSGWADLSLADDRDDCFIVGDVNHHALFPRVAAIVHHGGAGTTTAAARAGAPQVIIPQIGDQPWWARRVQDLGIGAAHESSSPTRDSLSAALESALTPTARTRAGQLAETVVTDGAKRAAEWLLES